MLYKYVKGENRVIPCMETDFKAHRILERQHIETWIENSPAILGEELLIISTEYDKFDKTNERVDLLALDKDGNLVIVELKRDDSGRNVDLQAIKYAAYCSTMKLEDISQLYCNYMHKKGRTVSNEDARKEILDFIEFEEFEEMNERPRIILVSKQYRPEVTASVLWLRKFGVDITCVKILPYDIGKGDLIFESNVLIPLPEAKDFIVETEKKERNTLTVSQKEYIEFYKELTGALKARNGQDYPPPLPRAYYIIPTGVSGVHFEWGFHGRPRVTFGVELHFERGSKESNLELLAQIENHIPKLKEILKEEITIQRDWGKTWARIYVLRKEGEMTGELKEWAVVNMTKMMDYLQPVLNDLKR